jgi:hypothetical protein
MSTSDFLQGTFNNMLTKFSGGIGSDNELIEKFKNLTIHSPKTPNAPNTPSPIRDLTAKFKKFGINDNSNHTSPPKNVAALNNMSGLTNIKRSPDENKQLVVFQQPVVTAKRQRSPTYDNQQPVAKKGLLAFKQPVPLFREQSPPEKKASPAPKVKRERSPSPGAKQSPPAKKASPAPTSPAPKVKRERSPSPEAKQSPPAKKASPAPKVKPKRSKAKKAPSLEPIVEEEIKETDDLLGSFSNMGFTASANSAAKKYMLKKAKSAKVSTGVSKTIKKKKRASPEINADGEAEMLLLRRGERHRKQTDHFKL